MSPRSQLTQCPRATLKGRHTQSPTLIFSTAWPTSITRPRFSCPNVRPCSKSVRPSYMCRSEPQMFVLVISTQGVPGLLDPWVRNVADANVPWTVIDDSLHHTTSVGSGLRIPIDLTAAITNAGLLIRGHSPRCRFHDNLVSAYQNSTSEPSRFHKRIRAEEVVCVEDLSGTPGPGDGGVRGTVVCSPAGDAAQPGNGLDRAPGGERRPNGGRALLR